MDLDRIAQKVSQASIGYKNNRKYLEQHPKLRQEKQIERCHHRIPYVDKDIDKNKKQIKKLNRQITMMKSITTKKKKRYGNTRYTKYSINRLTKKINSRYRRIAMIYRQQDYLKKQRKALKYGNIICFVVGKKDKTKSSKTWTGFVEHEPHAKDTKRFQQEQLL